MTSELGEILKFPSINSARIHFRVRFTTISKNINNSIIIKGIKWNIATNKDSSDNPQAPGPPYLFNAFCFLFKIEQRPEGWSGLLIGKIMFINLYYNNIAYKGKDKDDLFQLLFLYLEI